MNDTPDLHARLLAATEPLLAGERYSLERLSGPLVAIRAVVEHHEPVERGGVLFCEGCDAGSAKGAYDEEPPTWPCSTVETIAKHLGVKP